MRWSIAFVLVVGCGSSPPPAPPARAPIAIAPPEPATPAPAPPLLIAGGVSACARTDATIACWGSWSDDAAPGFDPAAPRALAPGVAEVALGWTHGCTRHDDGAVRCSGRFDRAPVPAELPALRGARALAAGRDFTCAIDAQTRLACFAARVYPGLREYVGAPPLEPVSPPDTGAGWTHVAATASGWQLCAMRAGEVRCWGSIDRAAEVVPMPPDATELVLAPDLGCARWPDGTVRCWRAERGLRWSSANVIDEVHADALVALHDRVCARDGRTWSCFRSVGPPRRWTMMDGASRIAGGMGFVCGLFEDGAIRCAGDDAYGQLGPHGAPTPTVGPPRRTLATDATALAMGGAQVCVVRADGSVACTGEDRALHRVRGLARVVQLSAGDMHACARTEGGEVRCWGGMWLDHGEDVDAPLFHLRGRRFARGASELVSGSDHACARTGADALRCWGSTWAVGGATEHPYLTIELPPHTRAIAAGGEVTCALAHGGTVRCFGRGSGDGAPGGPFVEVPAWRGASPLIPGSDGCGIFDGDVGCWGRNVFGELGDGTRTTRATPTPVIGIAGATAIARGDDHACALLGDGTVRCWGANAAGQLGDGTRDDRWRPVEVPGLSDVIAIGAGLDATCALARGGRLECWGESPGEPAPPRVDVEALFR